MSPTDQKKLGAFLGLHKSRTVRDYLGLALHTDGSEAEDAVESRRLWAQAQQTNPKFQEEALWVLAHTHLFTEAMEKKPDELLWLNPALPDEDTASAGPTDANPYELLGVPTDATNQQIQDAHRLRYRDARQLRNRHEAHQVYAALDEAWRVLSDPKLRQEFDTTQAPKFQLKQEVAEQEPVVQSDRQALTQSPDLSIFGPSQLEFELGRKTILHHLRIERIGPGLVDATVRCDQPWLKVRPETLDAHSSSQTLTVELNPGKVPGAGALGQLVLNNFNGQRISIHIRVRKLSQKRIRKGFLLGVALLALAVAWMSPKITAYIADDAISPKLTLSIQPPATAVWINNQKHEGGSVVQIDNLPADSPFRLRIDAQDHASHEETIVLKTGQEMTRSIELRPGDNRPIRTEDTEGIAP